VLGHDVPVSPAPVLRRYDRDVGVAECPPRRVVDGLSLTRLWSRDVNLLRRRLKLFKQINSITEAYIEAEKTETEEKQESGKKTIRWGGHGTYALVVYREGPFSIATVDITPSLDHIPAVRA